MEDLMSHPKVSVITINLNDADGLDNTLCSIKDQTFTDRELIVIDGGSSKNSIDVIQKHADAISYWISEPDNGIYQAMNKGIIKAKGEYCFFLNSGDFLADSTVLEKVFAGEINTDIVFGNLIVIDGNRKILGKCTGKENVTLLDVYTSTLKHQASFIKRELFDRYGLYDENLKIIADWEFFMRSVGLGDASVKYRDIDISFFDNNGISNKSAEVCVMERKLILEKCLPLRIREDYANYSVLSEYNRILKYKFSVFLLRILNKAVKLFDRVSD